LKMLNFFGGREAGPVQNTKLTFSALTEKAFRQACNLADPMEHLLVVYSYSNNFEPPTFHEDVFVGLTEVRLFGLNKGLYSQVMLTDVLDVKHTSTSMFSWDRLVIYTSRRVTHFDIYHRDACEYFRNATLGLARKGQSQNTLDNDTPYAEAVADRLLALHSGLSPTRSPTLSSLPTGDFKDIVQSGPPKASQSRAQSPGGSLNGLSDRVGREKEQEKEREKPGLSQGMPPEKNK